MKSPDQRLYGKWTRFGTRTAFILAALATLAVSFYEVENWRGERAWRDYRRQLEAKGEKMDLAAFTAPPVPDEKNFLKDPTVAKAVYFESGKPFKTNWLVDLQFAGQNQPRTTTSGLLGRIRLITNSVDSDIREIGRFTGPDSFESYLNKAFGFRAVLDPRGRTMVNVIYALPEPAAEVKLRCRSTQDGLRQLGRLVERTFLLQGPRNGTFEVRTIAYAVSSSAASILEDCAPHQADLDALYQAAEQRPCARSEEDWAALLAGSSHKFLGARPAVVFAAVHAKACLVTGNPGAARRDLTVMARLIEAERITPFLGLATSRLEYARLYADVVSDGLREHLWREVDLVDIQKQLLDMELLSSLAWGVRGSRIISDSLWPNLSRAVLQRDRVDSPNRLTALYLRLEPQGWLFLAAQRHDERDQTAIEWIEGTLTNGVAENLDILGGQLILANDAIIASFFDRHNLLDVIRSGCFTQTMVNQALIACGLERMRLSQNQFPEHLVDIPPRFMPHSPIDLFSGQPMKYLREDNTFRLYSVGWNRKDDGGAADDIVWKN